MRLSENLLVQRVDDQLVIRDQSTGAEIVIPADMVHRLVTAIGVLYRYDGGVVKLRVDHDWATNQDGLILTRDDEEDARWQVEQWGGQVLSRWSVAGPWIVAG